MRNKDKEKVSGFVGRGSGCILHSAMKGDTGIPAAFYMYSVSV